MYCLDTNIVVDYLRGDKKVIENVKEIASSGKIFITSISLCELYKGLHLSPKAQEELFILDNFANSVDILDLSLPICRRFGERFAFLEKKGLTINDFDLMIAVIADANNLTLITKDKDFMRAGTKVEMW